MLLKWFTFENFLHKLTIYLVSRSTVVFVCLSARPPVLPCSRPPVLPSSRPPVLPCFRASVLPSSRPAVHEKSSKLFIKSDQWSVLLRSFARFPFIKQPFSSRSPPPSKFLTKSDQWSVLLRSFELLTRFPSIKQPFSSRSPPYLQSFSVKATNDRFYWEALSFKSKIIKAKRNLLK